MYSVHHFWVYRGVKNLWSFSLFSSYLLHVRSLALLCWLPGCGFLVFIVLCHSWVSQVFTPRISLTFSNSLNYFCAATSIHVRKSLSKSSGVTKIYSLCLQNLSKMHKSCELGELERHFKEFGFWFQSWYITISVLHYYRTVYLFLVCFDIIDKHVGNLVTINIIHLVMFQVRRSRMWCVIVFILL